MNPTQKFCLSLNISREPGSWVPREYDNQCQIPSFLSKIKVYWFFPFCKVTKSDRVFEFPCAVVNHFYTDYYYNHYKSSRELKQIWFLFLPPLYYRNWPLPPGPELVCSCLDVTTDSVGACMHQSAPTLICVCKNASQSRWSSGLHFIPLDPLSSHYYHIQHTTQYISSWVELWAPYLPSKLGQKLGINLDVNKPLIIPS